MKDFRKVALCSAVAIFIAFSYSATYAADDSFASEIHKWQAERLKKLQADDGWPTLAGLFWLNEGANRVGSDPSVPVVLPGSAPKMAGVLQLTKGKVHFEPEAGVAMTVEGKPLQGPLDLISDNDPKLKPTVVRTGSVSFFIIERGDKIGVRVRDNDSPARKGLSSLEYYPVEASWKLEATFEAYTPAKKIPIVNILGMVEESDCPGALVFKIKGATCRLDVLEEDDEKGEKVFFVIFADPTNGQSTYGSGRYVYTATPDKKGKVVLDFNKAYSPPCAFTNYATCPLPPKQNRLPIAVTAGEKCKAKHS